MCTRLLLWIVGLSTVFTPDRARAWDYEGHRTINQLALAALPREFPDFVRTPEARERIAFLSGEPDRWRNTADLALRHVNTPDHFIDLEDLADASIALSQLNEFRYAFVVQFAAARAAHPERFPTIDPEKNKDRTRELPGLLPWAIAEACAKLKSQFSYLKAYEKNGTPEEIANARANIIYVMGVMGHLVGDAAQPLHTTKHFNGWIGSNPPHYTTARTCHAWIDGGFFQKTGGLSLAALAPRVKPAEPLPPPQEPGERSARFVQVLNYISAQQAQVETLYQLEKDGLLAIDNPAVTKGRAFLENQLLLAGNMLGSLWLTAWREAPPDTYLLSQLTQRQAAPSDN